MWAACLRWPFALCLDIFLASSKQTCCGVPGGSFSGCSSLVQGNELGTSVFLISLSQGGSGVWDELLQPHMATLRLSQWPWMHGGAPASSLSLQGYIGTPLVVAGTQHVFV